MNRNPYEGPQAYAQQIPGLPGQAAGSAKSMFVLAGVGAILASLYWAALAFILLAASAAGSASPAGTIMPFVLVVLYAWRGFQLFKGDPAAAKRILWLHGVGAAVALLQAVTIGGGVAVLYFIKVAINVFGAITAYLATRAYAAQMRQGYGG